MRRVLLLSSVFVVGCVCACDADASVRSAAGAGAMDCGFVPLRADPTAALDCATAAIAAHTAFYVGWQSLGRDSEVRTYVVGRADGSFSTIGYDGGVSGGCARLTESACTATPTRTTDASGRPVIACPGSTARPICGG